MKQKTKKILLLISLTLSLLFTLGCILAIYTGNLDLGVTGDVAEIAKTTQYVILIICVFTNILSIIFTAKDVIANKKKIIILNVIQLLIGTIINVISSIINIVILSSKTTDIEEVKEKKQLPVLDDFTKHKWYVYFIIFIALFILCYTPITNMLPIPQTLLAAIITMISLYVIQVVALLVPMFDELKRDFIVFKDNFKLYLSNMLPRFGLVGIAYLVSSVCLMIFVGEVPNNQATLNSLPIYVTAILAVVIAPLTEELMFRGFIKKFIKNDILFVILSSLIFGGLHVLTADSLQQFAYIIPYSILGFAFSLNYVKTRNISSNIFLHASWNAIVVILMTFMGI